MRWLSPEKKLRHALKRLEEVLHYPKSDIARDASIQRFEFTFELLWKTLRLELEDQGVLTKTPKDAFRQAFRLSWITNEAVYPEMLEARNKMSHIYDEQEARVIYKQIRQQFLKPIQSLLKNLG